MAVTRSTEVEASIARTAAITRLRDAYGVPVGPRERTDSAIAAKIKRIAPELVGKPREIIRAWLETKLEAAPRVFLAGSGRTYCPSKDMAMRAVLPRLAGIPKPYALVSNIPLTTIESRNAR